MMPGNPVVGGTVLRRAAIASPNYAAGTAGWTINADGSAEFNNLTIRGTFDGTDYELNSSGAFFYSGTPALGNLIISIAPAAGTDAHGNPYVSGLAAYTAIAGTTYAVQLGEATVNGSPTPGLFLDNQGASPPNASPVYSFGNASSSGTGAIMYSGKAGAGSGASYIECADSTLSGTGGGEIVINAGQVTINGTVIINGSADTASAGLTDGTINGSSSSAGLPNGTISGTSGGASAGTAHTHGPGSYAVTNGVHSHSSGTYAVANGQHAHVL